MITRRDLSIGLQCANIVHGAGESSPGGMSDHVHAVALHCRDEEHLRSVWEKLKTAGVKHKAILECDGPHAGQLMAIGCCPAPKKEVGRLLSSLPLIR